ncbi:MAG: hypothetical protein ABJA32_02215, partial [Ginsengibacter sp.]
MKTGSSCSRINKDATSWFNLVVLFVSILFLFSCQQKMMPVKQSSGGYQLVWSDEFNNNGRPDSTKWNYEHGFVRNHELQWYQPEN